jgi:hypothetical protein
MKSIVVTTLCCLSLTLGACAADTSSPASSQPGESSADVVSSSSGVSKIKTLQSAPLEAVRAKYLAGVSSFGADGYETNRLKLSGAAEADVAAALNKFKKGHLKGTVEIPTSAITTPAQAAKLVEQILAFLELDTTDNAAQKALSAALTAAVFQNGKAAVRVFTGSDDDNLTQNVFLFDEAHHEMLELNEGS